MQNSIKTSMLILVATTISCNTMKSTPSEVKKQQDDSQVYFKANGTEPFWGLTISEKQIKLFTMQDTIVMPHQKPIQAMDSNVKLYKLKSDTDEMSVQIIQTECTNDMSGEKFPYTISINYKKNKELVMHQLKGCGKYNTDYRLNDLWVLEKLNGKEMEKSFFKDNLPSLEINSETNSFSGFAGCNGMSGQLFYEKELLRFTKIITTMMYCGDTNKEREFLKALNSATKYTIENNRLTLSNPSKELMVFKKID